MIDVPALFGSLVFNDNVMQAQLPRETYLALKKTMVQGTHLELDVANIVATAMKNWAVENGATHFTHWFQPMTGITAEKHDSFIAPSGDCKIIMAFSGKELVRGEPDASSFPNGGLRTTFEARGYTVWDITSYAFIKDDTLCIPTAFCSYSGEALDMKTPLLRSMQALDKQALRILRLFGNQTTPRVMTTVGPEQEYFLIDKQLFLQRPDLIYTGRTLFGAKPPKGQELDDHYFGSIKPRVSAFMKDLEIELWKLGVFAKTKHNEVAPAQHELAPVFTTTNIATDHNQLTMALMKSIADKHGLACLLHEKPFAAINGSGKHINWSMATAEGTNLLEPGETPCENAQFLCFLVAIIKAVDSYQDLLRVSVASAGNDHRLGANEAPPAIASVFLGDELSEILDALEKDQTYHSTKKPLMEIGVTVLPHFPKDTTDRNRTSPFAFTGNRFEFRMAGSSGSIAWPNTVLNTIVADALNSFADTLENASDFHQTLVQLIKETWHQHKRIVFNRNNYADEWVLEAGQRGLTHLPTTADALPALISPGNIALFVKHHVLTANELRSRYDVMLEGYCKTLHIEALTMIDMIRKEVIPAAISYQKDLFDLMSIKKTCGNYGTELEEQLAGQAASLSSCLLSEITKLESLLAPVSHLPASESIARFYQAEIGNCMNSVRTATDKLETIVASKYWPVPNYAALLYSIR